jgi:hypothetical protein
MAFAFMILGIQYQSMKNGIYLGRIGIFVCCCDFLSSVSNRTPQFQLSYRSLRPSLHFYVLPSLAVLQAERKRIEYEAKLAHNQAQLSHEQRELQQLEQAIAEKEARLLHGGQIMDQV